MTKDVEFLSLGKSEVNTKSNNTSTNATKKEGLSLFDSLLAKGQEANKELQEKKEGLPKSEDTKTLEKNIENKSSKIQTNTDTKKIETKVEKKEEVIQLEEKSETKTELKKTDDFKESVKENKSTSSLLDRMIIEAKKNVKTVSLSNLEEVSSKVKIQTTQELKDENQKKSNNNTSSIFDRIVSNAKEEISKNKEDVKVLKSETKEDKIESHKKDESKDSKLDLISKDDKVKEKIETKNSENQNNIKQSSKLNESEKVTETDDMKNIEKSDSDKNDKTAALKEQLNTNKEALKTVIEENIKNSSDSKEQIIDKNDRTAALKEQLNINKEALKTVIEENIKKDVKEVDTDKNVDLSDTQKENKNLDKKVSLENNEKAKVSTTTSQMKVEEKVIANEKTENVAVKDFSKLDEKAIVKDEQRVNISKDELLKNDTKKEVNESKSLMDRLLDGIKKPQVSSENQAFNNNLTLKQQEIQKSNDVVTNIFLSSQKNSIYDQMLANKSEGVKIVKDAQNIEDVKKGAKVLDLGLKDAKVDIEPALKQKVTQVSRPNDKDNFLDKLAFERNLKDDKAIDRQVSLQRAISNITSTSSTINSSTAVSEESVVNLNVNPSLVMSIQSRIVGAQQQMSSMMSDVARNMYQNYKPPVTAFRINLFPSQLGHIAILMKNDKENSINISLNISNASTLDAFVENQSMLKEALNRNFNNNQTTFNLDFNMQNNNSNNQSFENNKQEQNKENLSSNQILESINENQNVGEDLNYL